MEIVVSNRGGTGTVDGITTEHVEALRKLGKMHENALNLIEVQSNSIAHPKQSLQAGLQILYKIARELNRLISAFYDKASKKFIIPKCAPKIKTILGNIYCEIGTTCLELEKPGVEWHFKTALKYLQADYLNPSQIISSIITLNNLGLVFSEQGKLVLSRRYLERSKRLYNSFVALSADPVEIRHMFYVGRPMSSAEVSDAKNRLGMSYAHTLYYLAHVYGKLDNNVKTADYHHLLLKHQLNMEHLDLISWAGNAATLSQYFTGENRFPEARHHLCAASFILDKYDAKMKFEESEDKELKAKEERFNHDKAHVARCWVKYSLQLLRYSRERQVLAADKKDIAASGEWLNIETIAIKYPSSRRNGKNSHLWFDTLDLKAYENRIVCQRALVAKDARKIFVIGEEWVTKAKNYYLLENHASDYVQLVRDHCQLYKTMAFLEDNESRRYHLHERRVDLTKALLKELNPQLHADICRELYYEMGGAYSLMMTIKDEIVKVDNGRPTPIADMKINMLANASIDNYTKYLNTLEYPKPRE